MTSAFDGYFLPDILTSSYTRDITQPNFMINGTPITYPRALSRYHLNYRLTTNTSYSQGHADAVQNGYINAPYLSAGPIGYKDEYGCDIGYHMSPVLYQYSLGVNTEYLNRTLTRVHDIPTNNWTSIAILAVGGGASGSAGGTDQNRYEYMTGGAGGGSGGVAFGMYTKSIFNALSNNTPKINIVVGGGGSAPAEHHWNNNACGVHGTSGQDTVVSTESDSLIMKGTAGKYGSGGYSLSSDVNGLWGYLSGSVINADGVAFKGGPAGIAEYGGNFGLYNTNFSGVGNKGSDTSSDASIHGYGRPGGEISSTDFRNTEFWGMGGTGGGQTRIPDASRLPGPSSGYGGGVYILYYYT